MFSRKGHLRVCARGGAWLLPFLAALPLAARVLLTAEEALHLAFPQGVVEKKSFFLTAEQKARATAEAGIPVPGVVVQYRVLEGSRVLAFAYLDTHTVRTMPETLLVILDPQGKVLRVEVLAFGEPQEYLPRPGWYQQFAGKDRAATVELGEGIRPVTGATLTAHPTTQAVRRVLALHGVVGQ